MNDRVRLLEHKITYAFAHRKIQKGRTATGCGALIFHKFRNVYVVVGIFYIANLGLLDMLVTPPSASTKILCKKK